MIENIFIIGIDGAGRSIFKTKWEELEKFQKKALTLCNMQTVVPSISAECWGSLLLGVSPDKHKYTNDNLAINKHSLDDIYPSIVRILKENNANLEYSSIVNWNPINYGIFEDYPDMLKISIKDDVKVTKEVKKHIENSKNGQFLYVHLDDLDHAGHEHDYFSEEYNKEAYKIDKYVGDMLQSIEKAGKMNNSLIIITTDHGGGAIKKSHGTDKPVDVDTFAIIKTPNGPENQVLSKRCSILDIAPFILHSLNIEIPEHLEGNYENVTP